MAVDEVVTYLGRLLERQTSPKSDEWKLVFDESIQPNARNPQSVMFELVSPILSECNVS
jgi:hypothetical protein